MKIRWRNVVAASIAIVVSISIVLVTPLWLDQLQHAKERRAAQRAAQPHPVIATDAQQLALLRALLQENSFQGVPPPPPAPGELPTAPEPVSIVLLSTSTAFCDAAAQREKGPCALLPLESMGIPIASDHRIPGKLITELVLANQNSHTIPNPALASVIFRQREVVGQFFKARDGWANFYSTFPKTVGILEISRAVLSQDGTHALLYVEHHCHGLCGTGRLYYFVRLGATWHTATKIVLWMS